MISFVIQIIIPTISIVGVCTLYAYFISEILKHIKRRKNKEHPNDDEE